MREVFLGEGCVCQEGAFPGEARTLHCAQEPGDNGREKSQIPGGKGLEEQQEGAGISHLSWGLQQLVGFVRVGKGCQGMERWGFGNWGICLALGPGGDDPFPWEKKIFFQKNLKNHHNNKK